MSLKTVLFSLALTFSFPSLLAQEIDQSTPSTLPNEKWSSQPLLTQHAPEYRPLDKPTTWDAWPMNSSAVKPVHRIDMRFAQDNKSTQVARLCTILTVALVATSLAIRNENRALGTGLAVGGLAVSLTGLYFTFKR